MDALINSYMKDLLVRGRAPNTIKNYNLHLQLYCSWCKQLTINYLELRPKQAKQYRNDLYDQGKSGKTINIMISALRGFYEFLIESELITGNPIIKSLRINERITYPNPLSEDERYMILSLIESKEQHIRLAFKTMLTAGIRVGEASKLTKDSIFVKDDKVILSIKNTKGGKSRIIPIIDGAVAKELYDYSKDIVGDGPIFKVSSRTLQGHAKNLQKRSGIHFYAHRLRHTFATDLLSKNIRIDVIQRVMGHSSLTTTRKYAETQIEDIMFIGNKMEEDE